MEGALAAFTRTRCGTQAGDPRRKAPAAISTRPAGCIAPMFGQIVGVAVGACLTFASPLASPAHDHELLMELASSELTRCQDELAKLRQFTQVTDSPEMKVMADKAEAIAEAECGRLKRAIENAAQTDRDAPPRDNPEGRQSASTPVAKARQDTSSPTQADTAQETHVRASPLLPDDATRTAGHEPAERKAAAAGAEPSGAKLSIHFLANSQGAAANAKTLAEQFGSRFQGTETHAEAKVPPKAQVWYSNPGDHTAAKDIAKVLASRGYTWQLEMRTNTHSDTAMKTVDIWLPGDK